MSESKTHSEHFDLANVEQGLKGCEAVFPHDPDRAYRGLREWADLLVADRKSLLEQFDAMRQALDFFVNQPELVRREDYVRARKEFFGSEDGYPTLDDRNPASVVGVPWNESGYAASSPASTPDASTGDTDA